MGVKKVDASVGNFEEVFSKFVQDSPNYNINLILFLADVDASTSRSWCPDCVRAEPVIYRKLEEGDEEVAVLRAYVGDRSTWRNPQHPLRRDPRFLLTGVPTLVRWDNNAASARLEDHQAHIPDNITSLLSPSNTT